MKRDFIIINTLIKLIINTESMEKIVLREEKIMESWFTIDLGL